MALTRKIITIAVFFFLTLSLLQPASAPCQLNGQNLYSKAVEEHWRWNLDEAMEKIVEWSKVWLAGGDVRVCMDKQINEFLNV